MHRWIVHWFVVTPMTVLDIFVLRKRLKRADTKRPLPTGCPIAPLRFQATSSLFFSIAAWKLQALLSSAFRHPGGNGPYPSWPVARFGYFQDPRVANKSK